MVCPSRAKRYNLACSGLDRYNNVVDNGGTARNDPKPSLRHGLAFLASARSSTILALLPYNRQTDRRERHPFLGSPPFSNFSPTRDAFPAPQPWPTRRNLGSPVGQSSSPPRTIGNGTPNKHYRRSRGMAAHVSFTSPLATTSPLHELFFA